MRHLFTQTQRALAAPNPPFRGCSLLDWRLMVMLAFEAIEERIRLPRNRLPAVL
jgi:hypothetical protein